jgi:hypothetical protein
MRLPRLNRYRSPPGSNSCAYYGNFAMSLTPDRQSTIPWNQALDTATVSTTMVTAEVGIIAMPTTRATNAVATVTTNRSTVLTPETTARTSLTLCRWALAILIQRRRSQG